jgi:hypothetical protein
LDTRSPLRIQNIAGFLGLFAGLCSVLVLIITAGEAWREHAQESWPEVAATIDRCNVDLRYFNGPDDSDPTWWLECQIGFRAGAGRVKATIHSGHRSNPSQGYPELMNQWVKNHPSGSVIVVRYDPTDLKAATPASEYMPNGGPRTRYNLRFLLICSSACISLLTIAMLFRRRARRTALSCPEVGHGEA